MQLVSENICVMLGVFFPFVFKVKPESQSLVVSLLKLTSGVDISCKHKMKLQVSYT